jgi:hypothetical protein
MSDDETPFLPGSEKDSASSETPAGGKIIHEDVFLARLAERRQAEQAAASSDAPVLDALLGALESIGLDPNAIAPDAVRRTRSATPSANELPAVEVPEAGLKEMALEQSLLNDLRAGEPEIGATMRYDLARRAALLRLAARLHPREVSDGDAGDALPPDEELALREGQEAGTVRALADIARRAAPKRRAHNAAPRVAEEQAPYAAGQHNASVEESPKGVDETGPGRQ